jgi:ABC-type polysaccharide/polyol phosphate transport system ATPase subunit
MKEDLAIRLSNLTLELPTYRSVPKRQPGNGLGSLQASVGGRLSFSRGSTMTVMALDDVSVQVPRGEKVGLIGLNGAGKSTMLKVMAGILPPTRGTVESRGKISTLFAESLGLKPEATGIENILLSGVSLGLTHGRVRKMVPEIVEFTELGDYIYMPLRTYSTGMRARLGFAVATSINPDILLIDEIIGAGDLRFQEKAKERLDGFMGSASTLVIASQSEEVLREFCDRAILLERGRVRMTGSVDEVLEEYKGTRKSR